MKEPRINREMIRAGQLVAAILLLITVFAIAFALDRKDNEPSAEAAIPQETSTNTEPPVQDVKNITTEPPTSPTKPVSVETTSYIRYPMTAEERAVVAAVVAAESGYESFEGQCLVAQCILNTAEARNMRPDEVVLEPNQYTTPNYELAPLVEEAVSAVFDDGYTVTDEPVRFFYAPRYCDSAWHENCLTFVLQEGNHRFFKTPV